MHRIVVIGGAGDMGTAAVRALCTLRDDCRIVLADRDAERAARAAARLSAEAGKGVSITPLATDVFDPSRLRETVRGARAVVNATGPYFRTTVPVLAAAIDERADYIDFGDDLEAADSALPLDAAATAAGVTAVIGAGVAPGAVNVAVRALHDRLDLAHSATVAWVTGASPRRPGLERGGRAVLEHMLHECVGTTWQVRDGRREALPPFRHATVLEFPAPLGPTCVYDLGHAELATLPRFLPSLRNVRTRGGLVPAALNGVFQGIALAVENGSLAWDDAVDAIVALDAGRSCGWPAMRAALAGIAAQLGRGELPIRAWPTSACMLAGHHVATAGGLHVRVDGELDGRSVSLVGTTAIEQSVHTGGMDAITGGPLAAMLSLLLDDKAPRGGVLAPEGWVEPDAFFRLLDRIGLGGMRVLVDAASLVEP